MKKKRQKKLTLCAPVTCYSYCCFLPMHAATLPTSYPHQQPASPHSPLNISSHQAACLLRNHPPSVFAPSQINRAFYQPPSSSPRNRGRRPPAHHPQLLLLRHATHLPNATVKPPSVMAFLKPNSTHPHPHLAINNPSINTSSSHHHIHTPYIHSSKNKGNNRRR